MRFTKVGLAVGIAALTTMLVGCTSASTSPSQVALSYDSGTFSSTSFQGCVPKGTLEYAGPEDTAYYYPIGQRVIRFSNDPGADFPPLQVTSKDGQVLEVSGNASVTLNTVCGEYTDKAGTVWPGGKLQKFHETIGLQDGAYTLDGAADQGPGWKLFLGTRVKDTIDRSTDNEALKYGWFDLVNNESVKASWEADVVGQVPNFITSQLGEDYLTVNSIILQKPVPSQGLLTSLTDREASSIRAESAEIDKRAAENFPGGIVAYLQYQNQLATNKLQASIAAAIDQGKIKVVPVPMGSSIVVNPGG